MQVEGRAYRVLETIGRGGFGTVYKAELLEHSGFTKTVALKILNESAAEIKETSQRLRDEARMLGLLRHRAIVQVDGLLQLNGQWAIVMEYVDGVDLKALVSEGPIPAGVAIEIIQEVANALYVAYELPSASGGPLRLLHRDIKPSNIQLTSVGEVKVLDFGVARAEFANREARTAALAFGSLGYMGPERLEGEDSHAGDVYALGAVLYELLTGEPLGKTPGEPDQHDAFINAALDRVWALTGSQELFELLGDCLSGDPSLRPPARELERRARAVRAQLPPPWVSDWAEKIVPPIRARRVITPGDHVGSTLIEDGRQSTVTDPGLRDPSVPSYDSEEFEEQPASSHLVAWLALGAAVMSALLVLAMGGGALYWMRHQPDEGRQAGSATADAALAVNADAGKTDLKTDPPPDPKTDPNSDPKTDPVADPTNNPSADPVATPVAVPVSDPVTKTDPVADARTDTKTDTKTTTKTEPAKAPRRVTTYGQVVIQGDMPAVTLVRSGKNYAPGRVPTGTYTIRGQVSGTMRDVGTITVAQDKTTTVICKARFGACAAL